MNSPKDPASLPRFRVAIIATVIVILLQIGLNLWVLAQLPEDARVPMHWNAAGKVDGWGSPASLWILPAATGGLGLMFYFLPRFEPRREHLLSSAKAYQATWIGTVIFFGFLHLAMGLTAVGHAVSMNLWMGISLGLLFMVIGNYFGKIQSNFFFGIRTPWTLTSELAWKRTHRLGGRLFMLLGLLLLILTLTRSPDAWLWGGLIVGLLVLVVTTAIYSYRVWRSDPDRRSLKG